MSALAMESFWLNKSACDDAERAYYEKLSGCKPTEEKSGTSPASDEVDLFASDEEAVEAPARVKPAPKVKAAPAKKAEAAPKKVAEAAVWPNKAECNDAETKFQEELSKNPGAFRNQAYGERTFIMLKPDAVQRGLVGEIMDRFEARGFKLVACKFMAASKELLMTHYSDLSKKGFFPELIRYMSSGPVVPMVWEGLNAVKQGRVMLGATNPKDSDPGTIRGDLCIDVGRNVIHGSDSLESAAKEISLWFKPEELTKWRSAQVEWCYEEEEIVKTQVQPQPSHTVDTLVTGLSSSEEMALVKKLNALETENKQLKKVTDDLKALVLSLEARVGSLEGGKPAAAPAKAAPAADEDDDDVDLFGSEDEEESEEKKRITEERLKAYHEKKAKKPQVIAKTSVLFDVKPWDDETDHAKMLEACKGIEMDGLVWGASKLVPIGYGIKKLQIMCTVEDAKVSIEELGEKMEEFEDYVQSVDVAAMNKI